MANEFGETVSYQWNRDEDERIALILKNVCLALRGKGYNPVNQLVGYLISGDPAYITSYQGARSQITAIERDEIVEAILKSYLNRIPGDF